MNLELSPKAIKDLKKLNKPFQERTLNALLELEKEPHKGHALEGSLKGARSLEFSLPGGEYRAAYYVILDDETVYVFMIGPHEGFYKEATRRALGPHVRRRLATRK